MNFKMYNKAALFYSLSILIPWSLWFIAGYISHMDSNNISEQYWSSIIAFLGLLAPVVITVFLARGNKSLTADLVNRLFNFKSVGITYILITIFLMPLSILLAQSISLLFGYGLEQFLLAKSFSFTSGVFPVWFMLIVAPVLEELAWHSYGTDCLRSRFNLFKTSVLFAVFWGGMAYALGRNKELLSQ